MKVLAGDLHETVYHPPQNEPGESKPLSVKSTKTYSMNGVTYISDKIGLHRVHNPSSSKLAVSLHCKSYLPMYIHNHDIDPWKCTRHPTQLITATISSMRPLDLPAMFRKRARLP